MGAPLHQYSTSRPASTTAVQPGYSVAPPSQLVPTVNGQGSTGMCLCLIYSDGDQLIQTIGLCQSTICRGVAEESVNSGSKKANKYTAETICLSGCVFPGVFYLT